MASRFERILMAFATVQSAFLLRDFTPLPEKQSCFHQ
jgi:hypothetical protein